MQKNTTSITESHVTLFIRNAPLEILERLKIELDKRLTKTEEIDHCRGVIRAMMGNSNNDSAPLPEESYEPEIPLVSARAKMMAAAANVEMSDINSMQDQLNALNKLEQDTIKNCEVEVMYLYTDNYGDAMVSVRDEAVKSVLVKKQKECEDNGWYCPYGLGQNKDLLKIKKFSRPKKPELCRIVISLNKWTQQGKTGYSCYAKM